MAGALAAQSTAILSHQFGSLALGPCRRALDRGLFSTRRPSEGCSSQRSLNFTTIRVQLRNRPPAVVTRSLPCSRWIQHMRPCRARGTPSSPIAMGLYFCSITTPRTLESESFLIEMAERTQIQLQAVTHMFFSQAVPVQRSRSARLRLENARRSYRSSFCNLGRT
jgi:hypothetical protein